MAYFTANIFRIAFNKLNIVTFVVLISFFSLFIKPAYSSDCSYVRSLLDRLVVTIKGLRNQIIQEIEITVRKNENISDKIVLQNLEEIDAAIELSLKFNCRTEFILISYKQEIIQLKIMLEGLHKEQNN